MLRSKVQFYGPSPPNRKIILLTAVTHSKMHLRVADENEEHGDSLLVGLVED